MASPDQAKKLEFKKLLKEFAATLQPAVSTEDGQWAVKGFLDVFKNVYTISADTKIVSKILEIHIFPRLLEFAAKNKYRIVLADCQNWYPDFSFVSVADETLRFAVDLKTTYRRPNRPTEVNGFTLGSHGEYFKTRTSKKNIQFPYGSYSGHFCLGLIYTRTDLESANEGKDPESGDILNEMSIFSVEELGSLTDAAPKEKRRAVKTLREISSVMRDLQFFAAEKWEIAADTEGSKNTANIGGIKNIDDILNGRGVFQKLGEAMFDEYWMNFGTLKNSQGDLITDLRHYLIFKGLNPDLAHYRSERRQKNLAKLHSKTAPADLNA
jgi:hypothetical protein